MSRSTWFQLTLLMIWGVVAMSTLSGSFWLTRTDWAPDLNAEAFSARDAAATRNLTSASRQIQDEVIELREVVMRLDRQNRILMSRLDSVESGAELFTASISSRPQQQSPGLANPLTQQMPAASQTPLKRQPTPVTQHNVRSSVQPYPLKVPGTDRTPTNAEIAKALMDR
uniref:hypothetical protein n=1 Tax=Pararhizobium sp. IMCC3301 TaxID=3067904 RepID=UPI0027411592|nr:hypothetical protein [Pararhizobium sp. IMCC3301]